jgi:hypothetical protein
MEIFFKPTQYTIQYKDKRRKGRKKYVTNSRVLLNGQLLTRKLDFFL